MLETDGPNHHGMHVLLTLVSMKELPDYGDRLSAQIGAMYRASAGPLSQFQLQSKAAFFSSSYHKYFE